MLGVEAILEFQRKATWRASRQKKAPLALFNLDSVELDVRGAPNLGTYVAKGWRPLVDRGDQEITVDDRLVNALDRHALSGSRCWAGHRGGDGEDLRLFVDKSGWGSSDEPALSLEQLVSNLRSLLDAARREGVTVGVGIVEEGQFQCYLGVFVKEK